MIDREHYATRIDTGPPPAHRLTDPDAELVEQLRRRDPEAPEALVATYGDRVYRLAIWITGNPSDAEEVVQDALWAATRKLDTFRGTAAFGSWLYRITANAGYQKRRGRLVERHAIGWDDLGPSLEESGERLAQDFDWSPRLSDPAIQAELRAVLTTAIDALPGDHRTTMLLHDVEGLSSPEIAETLQITLPAVKSRVHRARLFLRDRLAAYMDRSARR
jgi:RNA polymerase sigma-70 factor (ECF subfamily)